MVAPALEALGRAQEAITMARDFEKTMPPGFALGFAVYRACLEGDRETALDVAKRAPKLDEPEARFYSGCLLAKLNDFDGALGLLARALDRGYRCHRGLLNDPWLVELHSDSRFKELVDRAVEASVEARAVFVENGGPQLLGTGLDFVTQT